MHSELDLKSLWKELDAYSEELQKETKSLQEVWVKIAQIKSNNDQDLNGIMSQEEFDFLPAEMSIGLNVGGQLFETDVQTLSRDPYSILAACCRVKSPIEPTSDGIFFFNRDWWLFRHIIAFLRSSALPNELETLRELYTEASYYRLESLQRAIENIPVEQIRNPSTHIAVTWPGLMDGNSSSNPLTRRDLGDPSAVIRDGVMYKSANL